MTQVLNKKIPEKINQKSKVATFPRASIEEDVCFRKLRSVSFTNVSYFSAIVYFHNFDRDKIRSFLKAVFLGVREHGNYTRTEMNTINSTQIL